MAYATILLATVIILALTISVIERLRQEDGLGKNLVFGEV